jgi:hypothetical protein
MVQGTQHNRRAFIRNAASSAAAAMAASPLFAAPPAETTEPMKAGVFGIDYTFWGIWAGLLSPQGGGNPGGAAIPMKPTHIWDKNAAKAQAFAKRWGCEVVDRYDGMVGKVDVVLNGDLNNAPWQHLLLRPYLEAGIPCFIQRHFADTLRHLDEMLDLSARHSAPVIATVPFEHYPDVARLTEKIKTIGDIQGAFGTAEVTDEPHFHLPYMAMKILGYDVESVGMIADDVKRTGYLNINYVYPKGDRRRPFVLSMQAARPDVFSLTIIGDKGTASSSMPGASNNATRFVDQLADIHKTFAAKAQYEPAEAIRKKYLCLQAAYYSKLERNGSPVKVGSVPADWPLPAWQPGWYDGSEFRRA